MRKDSESANAANEKMVMKSVSSRERTGENGRERERAGKNARPTDCERRRLAAIQEAYAPSRKTA